MDEQHEWHPSKAEVADILDELRPIISELARRDEALLAAERWRRAAYTLV